MGLGLGLGLRLWLRLGLGVRLGLGWRVQAPRSHAVLTAEEAVASIVLRCTLGRVRVRGRRG